MVKSLLGIVAILLIGGNACLGAESKAKAKTDAIVAKVEYDKLGKKDLEDVLKSLQKEVLVAERKEREADSTLTQARRTYDWASYDQKPDALLRMLESMAATEKPRDHWQQVDRDFRAAQQVYLDLLAHGKPKPQPVDAASAKPKPPKAATLQLHFETVMEDLGSMTRIGRAKVKGGWLVMAQRIGGQPGGASITFYPDPNHDWDGGSLK